MSEVLLYLWRDKQLSGHYEEPTFMLKPS